VNALRENYTRGSTVFARGQHATQADVNAKKITCEINKNLSKAHVTRDVIGATTWIISVQLQRAIK